MVHIFFFRFILSICRRENECLCSNENKDEYWCICARLNNISYQWNLGCEFGVSDCNAWQNANSQRNYIISCVARIWYMNVSWYICDSFRFLFIRITKSLCPFAVFKTIHNTTAYTIHTTQFTYSQMCKYITLENIKVTSFIVEGGLNIINNIDGSIFYN